MRVNNAKVRRGAVLLAMAAALGTVHLVTAEEMPASNPPAAMAAPDGPHAGHVMTAAPGPAAHAEGAARAGEGPWQPPVSPWGPGPMGPEGWGYPPPGYYPGGPGYGGYPMMGRMSPMRGNTPGQKHTCHCNKMMMDKQAGSEGQGAQQAMAMSQGTPPATMPGMPGPMGTQHLDNMKRQIGIQEAQEEAWKAYADAFQDQMAVHEEKARQRTAMMGMDSLQLAQERLKIMEKAIEKRRATVAAYNRLFTSLSPEQKMLANRSFTSLPVMGGL